MVLFPPLLHQRLLQEKGVALISLSAYVGNLLDKDAKQVIQLSEDIYLTRVPYSYRVRIFRAMIPYLSKLQKFDLTMRAVVCFGPNVAKPLEPMQLWPQCWNVTTPSFVGLNKFRLDLANATRSSDGELTIKPPPIVLSNWYRELDPKACERSGKSIEGMIYPTPAFNALKRSSHRAILLAIPKTRHPLPPPYRGDGEQGKLSAADLSNMERFGIVRKPINLNPDASTQFSLKVPPIGFDYYYTLVVNFCREGESDDACAASAFPFRAAKVPRENSDLFRLIPGQFEVAHCGMKKHNFYFIDFIFYVYFR